VTAELEPDDGFSIVASFLETDSFTVGSADDSSDFIRDV
jgi:hypothetical protein